MYVLKHLTGLLTVDKLCIHTNFNFVNVMPFSIHSVRQQCITILITALLASAISFFQTLAGSLIEAQVQMSTPTEVGFLGGSLRALHLAVTNFRA